MVSFAQAYTAVITPFRCMQPSFAIIGHIEHHKAQAQAAISSVAMQRRLVRRQFSAHRVVTTRRAHRRKAAHGTRGGGGEGGGEQGGGEHASVSTQVPAQDQTCPRKIRYKPASKDIK